MKNILFLSTLMLAIAGCDPEIASSEKAIKVTEETKIEISEVKPEVEIVESEILSELPKEEPEEKPLKDQPKDEPVVTPPKQSLSFGKKVGIGVAGIVGASVLTLSGITVAYVYNFWGATKKIDRYIFGASPTAEDIRFDEDPNWRAKQDKRNDLKLITVETQLSYEDLNQIFELPWGNLKNIMPDSDRILHLNYYAFKRNHYKNTKLVQKELTSLSRLQGKVVTINYKNGFFTTKKWGKTLEISLPSEEEGTDGHWYEYIAEIVPGLVNAFDIKTIIVYGYNEQQHGQYVELFSGQNCELHLEVNHKVRME